MLGDAEEDKGLEVVVPIKHPLEEGMYSVLRRLVQFQAQECESNAQAELRKKRRVGFALSAHAVEQLGRPL